MNIEIPSIQREGFNAMISGLAMRDISSPDGFAFCPYNFGTIERSNWLAGCIASVFEKGSK